MYSANTTKELQHAATNLLSQLKSSAIQKEQIEELRAVLRFHEYRYYIQNDPLISDFEYDQLYKALEKLEADNPSLITPESPTQRVAKGLGNDFKKVQHLVPMLSLENSYNADDLVDWDRKAKEASGLAVIEYCVEPKFDGASISLIYEDDKQAPSPDATITMERSTWNTILAGGSTFEAEISSGKVVVSNGEKGKEKFLNMISMQESFPLMFNIVTPR